MNCLCYGGYGKAVVWNRVSDETGKKDGTITLCEWCEGLIDSTPTKRMRAFSASKLQWQNNWQERIVEEPIIAEVMLQEV